MKVETDININLNSSAFYTTAWICSMIIVCFITFSVWRYNEKAVKLYTESDYEEVAEKGSTTVYWRKAK